MKEKILELQKKWADGIIKMGELSNDRKVLESSTILFLNDYRYGPYG